MMDFTAWVQLAAEAAMAALALGGALDLARRGGFAPAQMGLVLAAGVGVMAAEASGAAGWVWLVAMGASGVLMYALWQVGYLVVALRESTAVRQAEFGEKPNAHSGVVELARVRAVASWPGRRSNG